MTTKELRNELAKYEDDQYLPVEMWVLGSDKPIALAAGEIDGIDICPCCNEPHLVVILTHYVDDDEGGRRLVRLESEEVGAHAVIRLGQQHARCTR
jgi:hypothetical protein